MTVVPYVIGQDPTETGVYACRVPHGYAKGFHTDVFLMWMDGRWSHVGSDQNYRGDVTGWIGPLQRRMTDRASAQGAAALTNPQGENK